MITAVEIGKHLEIVLLAIIVMGGLCIGKYIDRKNK
jgi:hypothetical protein